MLLAVCLRISLAVASLSLTALALEVLMLASGVDPAVPPGRWEVRNWGRRGADFPVLSGLFEEALRYDPDVVVYAMVLNDAERPRALELRQAELNNRIVPPRRAAARWLFRSRLLGFV